jgi:uncharacterized protein YneF (UPF0154 family)
MHELLRTIIFFVTGILIGIEYGYWLKERELRRRLTKHDVLRKISSKPDKLK